MTIVDGGNADLHPKPIQLDWQVIEVPEVIQNQILARVVTFAEEVVFHAAGIGDRGSIWRLFVSRLFDWRECVNERRDQARECIERRVGKQTRELPLEVPGAFDGNGFSECPGRDVLEAKTGFT